MLLWTRVLLANRTYWASWGSCASKWALMGPWKKKNITAWDPRHKYKMNDVVLHHKRVFLATVPPPEGRPYYGFQRYMQTTLVNEIGDPATSGLLCRMAGVQLLSFFFHFLLWYNFHLHSIKCDGLLMTLLANGLVTYVLLVEGRVNPSELARLNAEVTGS